jgi:hypothetical protein
MKKNEPHKCECYRERDMYNKEGWLASVGGEGASPQRRRDLSGNASKRCGQLGRSESEREKEKREKKRAAQTEQVGRLGRGNDQSYHTFVKNGREKE